MAGQTAKPKKKCGAGKTAAPASKKRASKGQSMVCELCGLSVVVEEVGDFAIVEERALLCCGKPMKTKASKAKTAKK